MHDSKRQLTLGAGAALVTLLAIATGDAVAAPQDPRPPVVPPIVGGPDEQRELLASDGQPVVAGRIPGGTDPQAIEYWGRVLAATGAARTDAERPPIRSFDLTFQLRLNHEGGQNNVDARFAFLDEGGGYLLGKIDREQRTSMRGPEGDWQIAKGVTVKLEGRDYQQSRRELDEWVSIARNFIAFTRPDGVRLVSLRAPKLTGVVEDLDLTQLVFDGAERVPMPNVELAERARELDWLEVKSPDFRLYSAPKSGARTPIYRALLGLSRDTGGIALAILNEEKARAMVVESSLLVVVPEWLELDDGYRVPRNLLLHRVDLSKSAVRFESKPGSDLYLVRRRARLNAPISPLAFVPQ
jgi:hypothetical protein